MKQRFINILFWSVLSAAFIGPGTITTASSAGAGFGFTLLWALVFSTVACIVLQEAAARLTLASGRNLGQAIRNRFSKTAWGKGTSYLVLISILLGCAAYEAGNILGAVAGAGLIFNISTAVLTLIIGLIAALLLWFGSTKMIAQILGGIVALMGLCFLTTAIIIQPPIGEMLAGAFVPHIPTGSEILVIGLIGTTVVPYNLFLGSGIKHAQQLKEMRISLTLAIVLGGIVSMGVLVVGTAISGEFSFEALGGALGMKLGGWASTFFAIGLAAAGLSSALTAPLASSLTAQSILSEHQEPSWQENGLWYRVVWGGVLLTGILFGVLQVQPIPAIILAQALNGIILPFVAVFLLLMVNNARLLSPETINSNTYNLLMGLIVFITLIIGLTNLAKALTQAFSLSLVNESFILWGSTLLALLLAWPVIRLIQQYRMR